MKQIGRTISLGLMFVATGSAFLASAAVRQGAWAQAVADISASVVAIHIPGASAIAQIGTFVNGGVLAPGGCANPSPIPTKFPGYTQPGQVLDPNRILVGSTSNFGAPLAVGVGQRGSFLSIDPGQPSTLKVPSKFAVSGDQASTLNGAVQMFSANSPHWLNSVNKNITTNGVLPNTAQYAGVSNPLGLSNNNGFGRIWPANAPFGDTGVGSSSILDPTGLPLAGPPNQKIGGVYVGRLTNRRAVTSNPVQRQVIAGALNTGGVGTALLGPSPDGTCKAVFVVVTADGAIVQEHTLYGLDGLARPGTVRPILGGNRNAQQEGIEPRFGVLMNPYNLPHGVIRQLFVSEPFYDTIAVVNLTVVGTAPYEVFGLGSVSRIRSDALNIPVDLAPVERNTDDPNWASNTTLDEGTGSGSDFYVANRGDNTIVRMKQDGTVVAIRQVAVNGQPLDNVNLNGIAASTDATDTTPPSTIFATFVDPNSGQGGVLAMPGF